MLVYRLENRNGGGPYRVIHPRPSSIWRWNRARRDLYYEAEIIMQNAPFPWEEFSKEHTNLLICQNDEYYFGCASQVKLFDYFRGCYHYQHCDRPVAPWAALNYLSRYHRFYVSVYESDDVLPGIRQLAFRRATATLLSRSLLSTIFKEELCR